jgi:hypothetical protein
MGFSIACLMSADGIGFIYRASMKQILAELCDETADQNINYDGSRKLWREYKMTMPAIAWQHMVLKHRLRGALLPVTLAIKSTLKALPPHTGKILKPCTMPACAISRLTTRT